MGSMVWVVGDSLGLADPLSHCSGINRPLAGGEGRCWGWATPSRWGGARSLGRCRRAVSRSWKGGLGRWWDRRSRGSRSGLGRRRWGIFGSRRSRRGLPWSDWWLNNGFRGEGLCAVVLVDVRFL